MATQNTFSVAISESILSFRKQLNENDWSLAKILLRLLSYEAVCDPRGDQPVGTFRWLPILRRLLDDRSPSSPRTAALLGRLSEIAKAERPPAFSTFPNDIASHLIANGIRATLAAIYDKSENMSPHTRDYLSGPRTFHRDLLALRSYLDPEDYEYILKCMWTSAEETKFSWRDKLSLWLGGNLTE